MCAPSVRYVEVGSIRGTCTGVREVPDVRYRSPGALADVHRDAFPFFHVQEIRNQKLLRRLMLPPVLNRRRSHS